METLRSSRPSSTKILNAVCFGLPAYYQPNQRGILDVHANSCLLIKLMNERSLDDLWLLSTCCRCRCSIWSCQTASVWLISHTHMFVYAVCFVLFAGSGWRGHHSCRRRCNFHGTSWGWSRRLDDGGLENRDRSRCRLTWIRIAQERTPLRSLIHCIHCRVTCEMSDCSGANRIGKLQDAALL